MIRNYKRGFTLIELLVVIAIIGLLSSIVLSSLNTARGKGANSAIKSNLAESRAQAELYYEVSGVNGYLGLCTTVPVGGVKTIRGMFDSAHSASGVATVSYLPIVANTPSTSVCHANTTDWAASVPLKQPEGLKIYWCVDSTGFSGGRVNGLANNGAFQYKCQDS